MKLIIVALLCLLCLCASQGIGEGAKSLAKGAKGTLSAKGAGGNTVSQLSADSKYILCS